MPSFRQKAALLLGMLLCGNAVGGDGYVIGLGAEGDSTDSQAFSAFGDFGLTKKTWISVTAAKAQAEGAISQLHTAYGDIGLDHYFDPIGIRHRFFHFPDFPPARFLRFSRFPACTLSHFHFCLWFIFTQR